MNVIYLSDRRERALEPIHRTPPRVGIYVAAARVRRSTGPQAHQTPYVADEERAINHLVCAALFRFAALVGALLLLARFGYPAMVALGLAS